MKRITLFLFLLAMSIGYSQSLPLDFESATTWADFNGGEVTTIVNPQNNADNNSANVGQMVKNAGEVWGGSSIVLSSAMDFANNNTFTMKAYTIKTGTKVLLKVEDAADAGIFFEQEVTMTSTNTWETLTFDYSGINLAKTYDKFILIFDNGTAGDGSADFTYYIDDIALSNVVTAPTCSDGVQNGDEEGIDCGGTSCAPCAVGPTLPIDFESATSWIDFNGGEVTTIANPQNNADNNSANVGQMLKNAGEVWGGSQLVLSSAMDFANNNTFTMKAFAIKPDTKVLLKVENSADSGIFYEQEVIMSTTNTWETLSFDYSGINAANSYDKVVIIFDNGTAGDGSADFTFLMDDIGLSFVEPPVELPLDFETVANWADFNGGEVTTIANPESNADNNSTNVGQMVKNAGEVWGGSSIVLSSAMDFANNDTFTMKAYAIKPDTKVLLKVENSVDAGIFYEQEVIMSTTNTWETLTFDYSGINTANTYDKVILIFDNGTAGDGSANFTFLIDDIALSDSGAASTVPLVSADAPVRPEADVLSVYSDAYSTNTVANFNFQAFSDAGANYTEVDIESDSNLSGKMAPLVFYGAQWDAEDVSAYKTVHFDYWTHDAKALNFYLIDETAAIPGGDAAEPRYSILEVGGDEAITYDQWVSVSIPLQHFLDYDSGTFTYDLNDIFQYKFDGNGTVYFDNIYFSNDPALSTKEFKTTDFKVFPNPTQENWIVRSESDNIKTIKIFNILGKTVLAISPNSKEVKINASQLTSGLYLAKIITEKGAGSIKLVKQ